MQRSIFTEQLNFTSRNKLADFKRKAGREVISLSHYLIILDKMFFRYRGNEWDGTIFRPSKRKRIFITLFYCTHVIHKIKTVL